MRKLMVLFSLCLMLLLTVSGMVLAADEEAVCNEVGGEWTSGLYRCSFFEFGENSHGVEYSYQYRFPTRIASDPFIQNAVSNYMERAIEEFMGEVEMTTMSPGPLFLETEYEIFYYKPHIVSIALFTSTYMGGARPHLFVDALAFDTERGQMVALDDLFVGDVDYIPAIQAAVQADLVDQLGEDLRDYIEAGTGDDPANYNRFTITDDALIIFFSQGDIGPSVVGPRSARVPLSDIWDIWALDVAAGPGQ